MSDLPQMESPQRDVETGEGESKGQNNVTSQWAESAATPRYSLLSFVQKSKSSLENVPPPDGGLQAWMQVLTGHLMIFNAFGYINTFGVFQPYYTTALSTSASAVSWIGSLEIFLVYFVGSFSGRLIDAGYLRLSVLIGLSCQIISIFTTSVCTQYWQLLLSQGIVQGLGNGFLFCPAIANVSRYFGPRKRPVVLAMVACGGATGGLVFPAIAQNLLQPYGFPFTVRIMGYVVLFNAAVILALTRPLPLPPRVQGTRMSLFDATALHDTPYLLLTAGVFMMLWGTFFAFYYIRPFATTHLGASEYTSFSVLLVINGAGLPGRLVPALIASRGLGPLNALILVVAGAGITCFCWTAVDSIGGIYAFAAMFGFFGGGLQALFSPCAAQLTKDPSRTGIRIGMVFSAASPGCLTGPPLAGAIISAGKGSYLGAQLFGGVTLLIGAGLLLAARVTAVGWKLKVRI